MYEVVKQKRLAGKKVFDILLLTLHHLTENNKHIQTDRKEKINRGC